MIGHFSLFIAWIASICGFFLGIYGAKNCNLKFVLAAKNSLNLMAFFAFISILFLAYSFVTHDYTNLYVWQHSSNEMMWYYCVSAIWGGMDGSMLLWAVIMATFSAMSVKFRPDVPKRITYYVIPVLCLATCFFLSVVLFLTNPFRLIPSHITQINGNGLNPLLQNPSMMIHPPMLYLGFTGFVVPFAYCIAALISKELGSAWIIAVRRWTLISWTFLTAGIILGGNWAYIELGWGGFWAWDPVENASFMPWLSGTAFLHSVMVQQQRGMLKTWNIFLATLTYLLTVFGTFLTRSGIVQSVHAFAETDVGWVFLVYLVVMGIIVTALTISRRSLLKSENTIVSYISRESAFLFNNLALLGICFVTLWGVMLPVLSEAVSDEKLVVGPPFFNRVNNPLFLFLIFLMAVGPLISWRRASLGQIRKLFLRPFIFGSLVSAFLMVIDPTRILSAISFGLSFFVVSSILMEFYKSAKARSKTSGSSVISSGKELLSSKRRKYAAHLIHFSVALCAVAITASSAYKIERDISLKNGESAEVGSYKITLDKMEEGRGSGYGYLRSTLSVYSIRTGELITHLTPEKRIYGKSQEVTTEVDIRSGALEDLYVALAGIDREPTSNGGGDNVDPHSSLGETIGVFKVFVNPLQIWLWVSSFLMLIGAMILIFERTIFSETSKESNLN